MYVRRVMIDADITAMIARNGALGYSSNWQVLCVYIVYWNSYAVFHDYRRFSAWFRVQGLM
jgi:hypothetical protein